MMSLVCCVCLKLQPRMVSPQSFTMRDYFWKMQKEPAASHHGGRSTLFHVEHISCKSIIRSIICSYIRMVIFSKLLALPANPTWTAKESFQQTDQFFSQSPAVRLLPSTLPAAWRALDRNWKKSARNRTNSFRATEWMADGCETLAVAVSYMKDHPPNLQGSKTMRCETKPTWTSLNPKS